MAKRPTMLDLVKAELPLGVVGKIGCPYCEQVWWWDMDTRKTIQTEKVTQEYLRDIHTGFLWRLKQEIEQHFESKHPEATSGN